jgi:hypothetical protein
MTTPNFALLRDAYAIIDGIPDAAFDLDEVVADLGRRLDCGTIACAAGWLSLHPTFAKRLRPRYVPHSGKGGHFTWKVPGGYRGETNHYGAAMAHLFNLSDTVARELFYARHPDEPVSLYPTDKALWQYRVRTFLHQQGQPVAIPD